MNNMFNECISLVIFPDIEGWFTYRLKNKSGMFYDCFSLIYIPVLKNINFSNNNIK